MIIYIDVLIFTNTVIDFLLLRLAEITVRKDFSLGRLIIASIMGGLSSLYILVESKSLAIDVLYKLFSCLIISLVLCGRVRPRVYVHTSLAYVGYSFLLGGVIAVITENRAARFVYSENLQQYIDLSPITLIIITMVVYLFVSLIRHQTAKSSKIFASASVKINDTEKTLKALIDTGHSVRDPMGARQVFIASEECYYDLIQNIDEAEMNRRKRVIPASTIGESCLLDAVRCDRVDVTLEEKIYRFSNPIIAASKKDFKENFEIIISFECIDRLPDMKVRQK